MLDAGYIGGAQAYISSCIVIDKCELLSDTMKEQQSLHRSDLVHVLR